MDATLIFKSGLYRKRQRQPMSKTPLIQDLLARNSFIGELDKPITEELMAVGEKARIARGESLFYRGDPGDSLILVLGGSLKIWNTTADGQEVVLGFMTAGDVIGEIAVLDGGTRSATATAMTDVDVFRLHSQLILPILKRDAGVMFEVVRALCKKTRASSLIIEDARRVVRARAASAIIRLMHQVGVRTANGTEINIGASQSDLAHYVGISRSNFNRAVSELERMGVLRKDNRVLTIIDCEQLKQLAQDSVP